MPQAFQSDATSRFKTRSVLRPVDVKGQSILRASRFNQIPFTSIFDRASFSFCINLNALNQLDAFSKSENKGKI